MGALPRSPRTPSPRLGQPVPSRLAPVPGPSGNPAPAREPGVLPPSTRSPATRASGVARHPGWSTAHPRCPTPPAPPCSEAVEALGYVPNRAARSLVTRRTDTVALVVSEPGDRVFGEPYFGAIVRGIGERLGALPVPAAADDGRHRPRPGQPRDLPHRAARRRRAAALAARRRRPGHHPRRPRRAHGVRWPGGRVRRGGASSTSTTGPAGVLPSSTCSASGAGASRC